MLPVRSGPLYLVTPSPWCCLSPLWSLVTVSIQQGPGGDWSLTVSSGTGDCLHTLPLATTSVEEYSYRYRDKCCRRREKTVIRLKGEMEEELFLWAEEEDRMRWMESIVIMQGDNTSCYEKITQLGSLSCVTICPTDQEVSSARVYGVTSSMTGVTSSITGVAGVFSTAGTAQPFWLDRVPRVARLEADMLTFDYDQMFSQLQPLQTNQERGTAKVVASVVKQLITTMNPSKVWLPACVLECRSLLESYADAFGRPEIFNNITTGRTEMERLEMVTSFYLSQLKCMRAVSCISKPYNPVHGELFICSWPEPQVGSVHFVAEQISHHPPVSSFYAECREANISLTSTLFTKSGLMTSWIPPFLKAMTVDNIGQATISLDSHDEVYTMSYPTAVATGILGSSPRLLLTGGVSITCSSHQGRMELTFEGESSVSGVLLGTKTGEQVATVGGDWRGLVEIFKEDGTKEIMLDMRNWTKPSMEKIVPSVSLQLNLESRRLWRLLTRALAGFMTEMEADTAKHSVENWARNMGDDKKKLQFFDVEGDDLENVKFKFRCSRANGT